MKGAAMLGRGAVMANPLKDYVPTTRLGVELAQQEANDDARRKERRKVKHALRVKLGGYYKIKGSDARKMALTGRVPSHVHSPEVYIPQAAPLRPEAPRKHRSVQAYRKRQEKRHGHAKAFSAAALAKGRGL